MKGTMSLIAAAYAVVALASFAAVRGVSRTLDGLKRQGGGIGDFSAGIADATRWPILAVWIAIVMTVVALLMVRRAATDERTGGGALAALGIVLGVASVLSFRELANFIAYAMTPYFNAGAIPRSAWVAERLISASVVTGLCFLAATVAAVLAFRARAAMRVAVFAVVVSLGVSTAMLVTLRDLSTQYTFIAHGRR